MNSVKNTNQPSRAYCARKFLCWAWRYPLKAAGLLGGASVILGVLMLAPYFLLRVKRLPPVDLASLGGLLGIAGGLGLFFMAIVGFLLTVAGFAAGNVLRSGDVNKVSESTNNKAVGAGRVWVTVGVLIVFGAAGFWVYHLVNAADIVPEARSFDRWGIVAIGVGLVAILPLYIGCKKLNKSDPSGRAIGVTLLFGFVQFVPFIILLTLAQHSDAVGQNPYLTLLPATFLLLTINLAFLFLAATTPIRTFVGGAFLLVILAALAVPFYFQEPILYSNLVVKHLNLGNTFAPEVNLSPGQCRRLLGAQAKNCPKDKEAVFPINGAQVISNAGDEFVFRAWTCGWDKDKGPFAGLLQYPLRISSDGRPGVVEEANGPLRTDEGFKTVMQCAELESGICGIGSRGRIETFHLDEAHFQPKQSILHERGEVVSSQIKAAYRKHSADAYILVFARRAADLKNDDPAAPQARADDVYSRLRKSLDVPTGRIKRENSSCQSNAPVECAALPKNEQQTCKSKPNHRVVDVWVVSQPETL